MEAKINNGQLKAIQVLYKDLQEAMVLLQSHSSNVENWSCYEAGHAIVDLQAVLMVIRSVEYHQHDCS